MIGDGGGRGFEVHSALAVRVEAWTLEQRPEALLLGLFDQQCRTPRAAPAGETRRARLSRPGKSQTWGAATQAAGRPPAGSQWVYVVAVRLLSTKMLARSRSESLAAAASFGPEILAILEQKLGPPTGGAGPIRMS